MHIRNQREANELKVGDIWYTPEGHALVITEVVETSDNTVLWKVKKHIK